MQLQKVKHTCRIGARITSDTHDLKESRKSFKYWNYVEMITRNVISFKLFKLSSLWVTISKH